MNLGRWLRTHPLTSQIASRRRSTNASCERRDVRRPRFEALEVTVQADDGQGGTAAQTICVTVTPVNERPV